VIGVKWIYKKKFNEKGVIKKHKARLVTKGYKQKLKGDYKEMFVPVIKQDTIRLVFSNAK
jgi:uncharacterized protein (UPF0332 family)